MEEDVKEEEAKAARAERFKGQLDPVKALPQGLDVFKKMKLSSKILYMKDADRVDPPGAMFAPRSETIRLERSSVCA
jgi:hypothetical protein